MAGYALAKLRFRGRDRLFGVLSAGLVIPVQVAMLPLFLLFKQLGLINTYWGVIVPSLASIFGIFLIRQYALAIPDDLLDAARIDGASELRIYWSVVLPVIRPILATLAIWTFLTTWNDFMWPLIVLSDELALHPAGGARESRRGARAGHRADDGRVGDHRAPGHARLPGAAAVLHRGDHGGEREGMSRRRTRELLAALTLAIVAAPAGRAQSAASVRVLDDFEGPEAWSARPADGVSLHIGRGPGRHGRAMRLDFDFHGHAGYAIARLPLPIELPENYQFSFWIRGAARPNTLEFKLLDPTGENVWWSTRPAFEFPKAWRQITIKRRHLSFAWGPAGGGEPRRLSAVEIVVTAAQGGRGTVWIDDFTLAPRPPERPYTLTPTVTASSSLPGHPAASVLDSAGTGWSAAGRGAGEWIDFDFLRPREYGGLLVEWEPGRHATDYDVQTSADGRRWETAYAVRGGNGGRDYIALPEHESRWLRLRLDAAHDGAYAIRSIRVEPLDWSATPSAFFAAVARDAPPGSYPRYFSGIQSYWTIVGASGDGRRALLNELGALEPRLGGWSIEPFLLTSGGLVTWNDAQRRQWLERGDLPIPSVEWRAGDLTLTITAFAAGPAGASSLLGRYRVANTGAARQHLSLALALRPFQVNPPSQWLNTQGGPSRMSSLRVMSGVVVVNDTERVVAVTPAGRFGATRFDQGEVVEFLRGGTAPPGKAATDTTGRASGALVYPMTLAPGETRDVIVEIPLAPGAARLPPPRRSVASASAYGERRLAETVRQWSQRLDRVELRLPASAADLVATMKANLAYILINRDGPAIEPGARSYRRAWIRDGAMISAALLRLGQADEVRRFLEWYAPYQYPDGKVPCCVDSRGADPVPENDSHGQLIYLAMEYYRHTGDRATLARMWPHVGAGGGLHRLAARQPAHAGVRAARELGVPRAVAAVDQSRGLFRQADALVLG